MSGSSMPGMPNNAKGFPGGRKNLHVCCLYLYLLFALDIPNCAMLVLLFVFNMIHLPLLYLNCSSVVLGNGCLHMIDGTVV